ncbi:MAG: hypothetical protein H6745_06840 [Deltaproteobacteria bacterium]|nr:hypothetical protein [Deltaproteobacteria bacterium]
MPRTGAPAPTADADAGASPQAAQTATTAPPPASAGTAAPPTEAPSLPPEVAAALGGDEAKTRCDAAWSMYRTFADGRGESPLDDADRAWLRAHPDLADHDRFIARCLAESDSPLFRCVLAEAKLSRCSTAPPAADAAAEAPKANAALCRAARAKVRELWIAQAVAEARPATDADRAALVAQVDADMQPEDEFIAGCTEMPASQVRCITTAADEAAVARCATPGAEPE